VHFEFHLFTTNARKHRPLAQMSAFGLLRTGPVGAHDDLFV
jgi:hypothetical protein